MSLVFLITNAGRAALVNAQHDGTNAVRIAQCGLSGQNVVANAAMTALAGEFKRLTSLSGATVAADIIHVVVRDETGDTYTARSLALYLTDGTLFGLYGQADPIINKAAGAVGLLAIDLTLADVSATAITFGNANFLNPPATTTTAGVIELADDGEAAAMVDAVRGLTPRGMGLAFTAAKVIARLLTVDGAGSGLDADVLDGQQGSWYSDIKARLGYTPVQTGTGSGQLGNEVKLGWSGTRLKAAVDLTDLGSVVFDSNVGDVWRASNDGAGSGLDADLLDGQQGSYYTDINARLGYKPIASGTGFGQNPGSDVRIGWGTSGGVKVSVDQSDIGFVVFASQIADVWRAANDGAGSGMDADLLDGQQGSYYTDIVGRLGFKPVQTGTGVGQNTNFVSIGWSGTRLKATVDQTDQGNIVFDSHIANVWRSTNDGAGSGLDADLLDGWERDAVRDWGNLLNKPAAFPPASHTHSAADIAGAFLGSMSSDGYVKLPNGVIVQWVSSSSDSAGSENSRFVNFPVTFPNACLKAIVSTRMGSASSLADAWYQTVGAPDVGGVTIQRQHAANGGDQVPTSPDIIAIGF